MALIRINTDPTDRQLRQFGIIWLVFFLLAGAVIRLKAGPGTAPWVLWAAAVVVPVAGRVHLPVLRRIYIAMCWLVYPIGMAISYLMLALTYYGVLTPIGLLMRLFGYDPMKRRLDPTATTYWMQRETGRPVKRYFRQY